MEAILDYYEINTHDIWVFEAYQYLINKRSDDQIDHIKNILEQQILKTRREQIQLNKTITIESSYMYLVFVSKALLTLYYKFRLILC